MGLRPVRVSDSEVRDTLGINPNRCGFITTTPIMNEGEDIVCSIPELTGIYKGGNSWRVFKCTPGIEE